MELSPLARAWRAWESFWFAPVDARQVAAMRISLGLLLLVNWVQLWPALDLFLGSDGLMDAPVLTHRTEWALTLDHLSRTQTISIWAGGIVVLLAFTVGFGTRVANVLAALLLVGAWHRSPWMWNGGDRLVRIWTLILCMVPSGAAWSVDARIRRWRGLPPIREVGAIAHRLVILQLCVMYTATGLEKLRGSDWLNGTAIYYAMSDAGFSKAPALFDPFLQTWLGQAWCAVMSWTTVAWELLFVPLVAFRRTRWWALGAGVVLHVGIFATLSVGVFGPASVWGYQAFLLTSRKKAGSQGDGAAEAQPQPLS